MIRRALWMGGVAMVALALAGRPAAADVSVGTNLGVSILMPSEGGDTSVLVDVPSGAGLGLFLIGTQPGLRIGITDAARREEFHLDTGLAVISGGGDTYSAFQLVGSYQHAFGPATGGQPYATAGLGMNLVSGGGSSANAFVFGLGIGHRQWVAGGHGTVRGELRYEHIGEAKESGFTVQPALNCFQMRLGFDLWAK